jgi:hypothetical protein
MTLRGGWLLWLLCCATLVDAQTLDAPSWALTASATDVNAGERVELRFSTGDTNVHVVRINGLSPSFACSDVGCAGVLIVAPVVTTTYTLTSLRSDGTPWPPLSVTVGVTRATPLPGLSPDALPPGTLLGKANLAYEGSFALPSFTYGYVPNPNGGMSWSASTGTLLVAGHDHFGMVGEVSPPELRDARTQPLLVASPVQALADPTDGGYLQIGPLGGGNYKVGGVFRWKDICLVNGFHYYDALGTQRASLWKSGCDFSVRNDAVGPFKVGELRTGYTSGYITTIPRDWQERLGGPLLIGQCCLSIIGRTSSGPAAFAFNPDDLNGLSPTAPPLPATVVPATPLLYYPIEAPLQSWYQSYTNVYNGTTSILGAVFPDGSDSVLFFGRIGTGDFCYGGAAPGSPKPCVPGRPNAPYAEPYQDQVWAFAANDLLRARQGEIAPWDVRPYAIWTLELPTPLDANRRDIGGGVAYDPATQRIFLAQRNGDVTAIHVYRVVAAAP